MKIAHIIPHFSPFLYKKPIGIKKMVKTLTEEQIKQGHEVFIIAPKGSQTPIGKLIETIPSLRELNISVYDFKSYVYGFTHASMAIDAACQCDIIHSHMDYMFLPFIPVIQKPVISTIHGVNFSPEEQFIFRSFYGKFPAVAISESVKKINTYIKYSETIYNGVPLEQYQPNFTSYSDYMYWLSRFNPNKGALEAIQISALTKRELKVMGFKELGKEDYFQKMLSLIRITPCVEMVRDTIAEEEENKRYFRNAKLFIFPVGWEEPFGLVMIEAMASGTPVVAFARGSIPEVIRDGDTGFIVNSTEDDIRGGDWIIKKTGIEGLCEAVERIYAMPEEKYRQMRKACREHVEKNFSSKKMAERYEKIYKKMIFHG
jgi:glycosyltransferase involved in cell wall biosynthesis